MKPWTQSALLTDPESSAVSAAGLLPLESHADGSDSSDVELDGHLDDVDVDMYDS